MFLKARLRIGTPEEQESSLKVMRAIFQILDKIPKLKVSASAQRKAQSVRKAVEKEKNDEEREAKELEIAEKKRIEQLEFNKKLRSLPPAEQKKLEEKRQKKELEK